MFTFRFESLLQLARAQRDSARAAVAATIAELDRLKRQREQLVEQRRALLSSAPIPRLGVIPVDRLLAQGRYEGQLARQDAHLVAAAGPFEAELECRRGALQVAESELRRLELLKEKEQRLWNAQQAKSQQSQLDEIASRRASSAVLPAAYPHPQPTLWPLTQASVKR